MPEKNTEKAPDLRLPLGRSFWAIEREALRRVLAAQLVRPRIDVPVAAPARAARRGATQSGGFVAVIPITGLITPRGSFFSFLFGGGGGLMEFRESFREAVNSPEIQGIVLDVDSPGGYVDLVPETAQEIYDARGSKPIVAVSNTMAASAAYYLAAQADEVVVTPSGSVGSIGVYMVHDDWSGFNEQMGIDPTYIYAGKHKVDGNPDQPLSDDAREDWQQEVDDLYAMFVQDVARGRGVSADTVISSYGEGRTMLAARALQAGMVDRVETLEEVIGGMLSPGQNGAAAARIGRGAPERALLTDPKTEPDGDPAEPEPAPVAAAEPPAPEVADDDTAGDDGTDDEPESSPPEAQIGAAERLAFIDCIA